MFLLLFSLFFSNPAQASSCTGLLTMKGSSFRVNEVVRGCQTVSRVDLMGLPLEAVGCVVEDGVQKLLVKRPEYWWQPCLPLPPPETFTVYAEDFTLRPNPLASGVVADCQPAVASGPSSVAVPTVIPDPNLLRSITMAIQSFDAQENNLKTVAEVEKYHRCLLHSERERNQQATYLEQYRFMIESAAEAFNVPITLMSCLCGRESRFDAGAASHTGVVGLCQATRANLEDVEKWRSTIPEIGAAWRTYVDRLGTRLEDASCANAMVTRELLAKCPSLSFGAAAIYLSYANSRVGEDSFRMHAWDDLSIQSLTAFASAYNVGVGFTAQSLEGLDRSRFAPELLRDTCGRFGAGKFRELKNHMVALRACMQGGSWLDHQGKPMGGECASTTTAAEQAQLQRFINALPQACGG